VRSRSTPTPTRRAQRHDAKPTYNQNYSQDKNFVINELQLDLAPLHVLNDELAHDGGFAVRVHSAVTADILTAYNADRTHILHTSP